MSYTVTCPSLIMPMKMLFIIEVKVITVGLNKPRGVLKAALYLSPSLMRILPYPPHISNLVKYIAPQASQTRYRFWGICKM